MKTRNMFFVSAALSLFMSPLAFADVSGPSWVCSMHTTRLTGNSVAIGLSVTEAHGEGVVHCSSLAGRNEVDTPVHVSLTGIGGGVGFAHINGLDINVAAIGVSTPNDLMGTFRLQAAVAATVFSGGGSLHTYLAVNDAGLSAGVGIANYQSAGLDANAELQTLSIKPIETRE